MIPLTHLLSALTITVPCVLVSIGQAMVARATIKAIDTQPAMRDHLLRMLLISLALSETIALASGALVAFFIRYTQLLQHPHAVIIQIGALIALIIPASIQAIGMSRAASRMLYAVARQPQHPFEGMRLLLLCQTLGQTPLIFTTLIALWSIHQATTAISLLSACNVAFIGIAAGLASIGSCVGMARFSYELASGYAYTPNAYTALFNLCLMSMALLETPFLLGLSVALLLSQHNPEHWHDIARYAASSAIIGLCNTWVCWGSSTIGGTAARLCGANPTRAIAITRSSLLFQTIVDTCAIYGLLIAIFILFAS